MIISIYQLVGLYIILYFYVCALLQFVQKREWEVQTMFLSFLFFFSLFSQKN